MMGRRVPLWAIVYALTPPIIRNTLPKRLLMALWVRMIRTIWFIEGIRDRIQERREAKGRDD